jgi:hypothetical protein
MAFGVLPLPTEIIPWDAMRIPWGRDFGQETGQHSHHPGLDQWHDLDGEGFNLFVTASTPRLVVLSH